MVDTTSSSTLDITSDSVISCPFTYRLYSRGDGKLLICPKEALWVRTNDVGLYIIENLLDGRRPVAEVFDLLASEYGLPSDLMEEYVSPFLQDLVKSGFGLPVDSEDVGGTQPRPWVPMPASIWVHPWQDCNLRCAYCYYNGGDKSVHLPAEALDRMWGYILGAVGDTGQELPGLVISGGEPMLYPDSLVEILKRARKAVSRILVLTNGTVGTEQEWRNVLEYADRIQVSVDGASAEVNDAVRGTGSFARTLRTMETLRRLSDSVHLEISFTPVKSNYHDMAAMVDLANSLEADLVRFGHLYKFGRARSDPTLEVDRESLIGSFEKMLKEYKKVRRFYSTGRRPLYLEIAGACEQKIAYHGIRTGCGVGLATFTIAHDGTVFPCPSIFSEHLDYGSVVTDEPSDLFERAQRIAEEWGVDRLPQCHGCEMKYFCGGGCRASALATGGDPLGPDPYWMNPEIDGCHQIDKLMEAMWNYPDYRKAPKP